MPPRCFALAALVALVALVLAPAALAQPGPNLVGPLAPPSSTMARPSGSSRSVFATMASIGEHAFLLGGANSGTATAYTAAVDVWGPASGAAGGVAHLVSGAAALPAERCLTAAVGLPPSAAHPQGVVVGAAGYNGARLNDAYTCALAGSTVSCVPLAGNVGVGRSIGHNAAAALAGTAMVVAGGYTGSEHSAAVSVVNATSGVVVNAASGLSSRENTGALAIAEGPGAGQYSMAFMGDAFIDAFTFQPGPDDTLVPVPSYTIQASGDTYPACATAGSGVYCIGSAAIYYMDANAGFAPSTIPFSQGAGAVVVASPYVMFIGEVRYVGVHPFRTAAELSEQAATWLSPGDYSRYAVTPSGTVYSWARHGSTSSSFYRMAADHLGPQAQTGASTPVTPVSSGFNSGSGSGSSSGSPPALDAASSGNSGSGTPVVLFIIFGSFAAMILFTAFMVAMIRCQLALRGGTLGSTTTTTTVVAQPVAAPASYTPAHHQPGAGEAPPAFDAATPAVAPPPFAVAAPPPPPGFVAAPEAAPPAYDPSAAPVAPPPYVEPTAAPGAAFDGSQGFSSVLPPSMGGAAPPPPFEEGMMAGDDDDEILGDG